MLISTLTRCKDRLGITGSGDDTRLTEILTGVSAAFERYMRRGVESRARNEVLRVRKFAKTLRISHAPVAGLDSIKYADRVSNIEDAAELDESAYSIDLTTGTITFHDVLTYDPGFVEVYYTGGMATSATTFVSTYPEIAHACDMQVVDEFRRLKTNALSGNVTFGGGQTTYSGSVTLLPRVMEILDSYRRHYIGG